MAATYLTLISVELLREVLYDPESIPLPPCLHLSKTTLALSERHPGMWLAEITDDDAPEVLNGQHVDLTFTRHADQSVTVAARDVVRF